MVRRRRSSNFSHEGRILSRFKDEVMKQEGYAVNPDEAENVKYEVARTLGIPLNKGYNGNMSTEDAGKVGGKIGGAMVKNMIKMAREQISQNKRK